MMRTTAFTLAVVLAALLSPDCPSAPKPPYPAGTWGGENAALIADDTSAHIHIGCTYGNIHHRLELRPDGSFDMVGEHNITAHPIDLGVMHPARFSGRVSAFKMTLTVALTDTAVTLGPVVLMLDKEPHMGPCPICRRPSMRR